MGHCWNQKPVAGAILCPALPVGAALGALHRPGWAHSVGRRSTEQPNTTHCTQCSTRPQPCLCVPCMGPRSHHTEPLTLCLSGSTKRMPK